METTSPLAGGARGGLSEPEERIAELEREMRLLSWHKVANNAAMKAAIIRTRKLKHTDKEALHKERLRAARITDRLWCGEQAVRSRVNVRSFVPQTNKQIIVFYRNQQSCRRRDENITVDATVACIRNNVRCIDGFA